MADRIKPVALVSMPSLSARFPSFQLALLKPTLERAGIPAQPFSLYMYFGTQVGWPISETIADVWPTLVGEWIWSKAAFGDEATTNDDEYFHSYEDVFRCICEYAHCTLDDLRRLRYEAAPQFIDFCVNSTDWGRFGLIGFSIVFQQLLASVAMARALKKKYPHIPTILGGASMEDDIADEIMKGCPSIDFVHCGDSEITLPKMIRRLYAGESMEGLEGIVWRDPENKVRFAGRAPNFMAMNETPTPDFDEYFYARKESGYENSKGAREPLLSIEAARGCWWGEKNHCTFCGLNRSGMEFRAKDADKVIEQLEELVRRYGQFHFNAIDNIMAPEYLEKLFGKLAAANTDIRLHYEIRPKFSRAQLGRMKRGGLFSVQPGVESLNTNILKIMKKLSTGMRNVELIKWCTFYRINNLYNILCRFPGETAADYQQQCETVALIPHFQPPYAIVKARADRGSPMYTDPASQSIYNITPARCYNYLLPEGKFNLRRISYYFEHQMDNILDEKEYDELFRMVGEWQESWQKPRAKRPYMIYRKSWSAIRITDGRYERVCEHMYSGNAAVLYEYCAEARTPSDIARRFKNEPWVEPALQEFVSKDLILFLDGRYLSLALPENPYFDLVDAPEEPAHEMPREPVHRDMPIQIT